MANAKQQPLPAILFSHFDGSAELIAMAKEFISAGYPIIACVQSGDHTARQQAESICCDVAEHEPDGGLRAGLDYFRDNWMEKLPGVIVFEPEDGFGVGDALQVAEVFQSCPDKLVLASRKRNSRLGFLSNMVRWLAALAFTLVHGRKVGDPWASLRAIPSKHVSEFLGLKGDGCGLHLNMLLNLQHLGIKTVSVSVTAPYDYECGSGLPDRFFDIFRILLLPLKFVSASVLTLLVDYVVTFMVGYIATQNKQFLTILIARFAGAVTGYFLNKNIVFKRRSDGTKYDWKPLIQYFLLASINCAIALLLIPNLRSLLSLPFLPAKVITDILLFVGSFLLQRDIIFRKKIK